MKVVSPIRRKSTKPVSIDSAFLREKLVKKAYLAPMTNLNNTLQNDYASSMEELTRCKAKIIFCTKIFHFDSSQNAERDQKARYLTELLDLTDDTENCVLADQLLHPLFQMFRVNLFRPFHFVSKVKNPTSASYDADEEETLLEPSWPHLVLVYQLFLRVLISGNFTAEIGLKYLDNSFIKQLIWLFRSEDTRERDILKNVLHRMYGKFVGLRPLLKTHVQNSLVEFVYEDEENSNGVSELLEVFESIIDGFKVPLKAENIDFLEENLIPLHKSKALPNFHQQLSKCLGKYVQKDVKLANDILSGLLRYWPITNSTKEVNCLNELEEILEICEGRVSVTTENKIFRKLCKCVSSLHFQVAEKALMMVNDERIMEILTRNKLILFPILVGSLLENSENHWNNYISMLTMNTMKVLMEIDLKFFEECSRKSQSERLEKERLRSMREAAWRQIEKSVKS